ALAVIPASRRLGQAKRRPNISHSLASGPIRQLRWLVGCPVDLISTARHPIAKCRVLVVAWRLRQPMPHRIEMNVVEVRSEIAFVANKVLPITPLPNCLLTA